MTLFQRVVWAFRWRAAARRQRAKLAQLTAKLEQLASRGPEYSTANTDLQRLVEEYKVKRSEY